MGMVVIDLPESDKWGILDMVSGEILRTFAGNGDEAPVWSPNAEWVGLNGEDLVIIRVQSRETEKVVDLSPDSEASYFTNPLAWSPDSEEIAFSVYPAEYEPSAGPSMGIYIYDVEANPSRHYCTNAEDASLLNFAWSPSGRLVAWSVVEPAGTRVLDLIDGSSLLLPGIEVIGWGKSSEE